jgi:hypothetical protein
MTEQTTPKPPEGDGYWHQWDAQDDAAEERAERLDREMGEWLRGWTA